MIFKASVKKQGVASPIWFACGCAEVLYRLNGVKLVVTSMMDSHDDRPKSLHLKGLAVDWRTRTIPAELLPKIVGELRNILEPMGFDVVLESDHVHCEYQPKGRETWQPMETA